mgnify:CR=1 FL=1|jgi:hypothetical protein
MPGNASIASVIMTICLFYRLWKPIFPVGTLHIQKNALQSD